MTRVCCELVTMLDSGAHELIAQGWNSEIGDQYLHAEISALCRAISKGACLTNRKAIISRAPCWPCASALYYAGIRTFEFPKPNHETDQRWLTSQYMAIGWLHCEGAVIRYRDAR